MYSNNIVNFQESMTILNACTKKAGNLLNAPRIYINKNMLWQANNHFLNKSTQSSDVKTELIENLKSQQWVK